MKFFIIAALLVAAVSFYCKRQRLCFPSAKKKQFLIIFLSPSTRLQLNTS